MNLFQELTAEQLDSAEGPPLPEEQQAKRARLETRWQEAARAVDLQQRQMQDAVAAVTLAAQAAAQAVASLAGHMARSAAPVGAEGADRAWSGGAPSTPPVQAPVIASSSPPLGKLTADESKSIMASTKGFEASVRKLPKCNTKVDKGKD